MGFLSKVRKKIKRQIQPGNMMIGNIRKVPRRPNMIPPSFRPRPFGPGHPLFDPPRMARPVRPGDPVQPRPIFPRRPIEKGYKVDPSRRKPRKGSSIRDAIRRSEQQQFANPTIFGQPIGNFDFGNMPNFSIDDIMEMPQVPTQMPMTQDLPEVSPVGMMPQMRMGGMQDMEPRMMMQAGEDVSLERELFSLQAQLENLQKQLEMDRSYNDLQTIVETSAEIDAIQKRMAEIQMEMARQKMIGENPYNLPFDPDAKAAREKIEEEGRPALEEEYRSNPYNYPFNKISIEERKRLRPQLAEGGEPFPDLSGDGQITRKDILMGQGVKFKAEGGEMMTQENEIDAMLGGMDSEEAGAMEDLEQMAPEMEMIDQLVTMVVQMIQQGASEEEVIMFLREQGLDDEDIGTVLQLVAEMAEAEAMPQDGIGEELEQLA
jgi:hypothetical protein